LKVEFEKPVREPDGVAGYEELLVPYSRAQPSSSLGENRTHTLALCRPPGLSPLLVCAWEVGRLRGEVTLRRAEARAPTFHGLRDFCCWSGCARERRLAARGTMDNTTRGLVGRHALAAAALADRLLVAHHADALAACHRAAAWAARRRAPGLAAPHRGGGVCGGGDSGGAGGEGRGAPHRVLVEHPAVPASLPCHTALVHTEPMQLRLGLELRWGRLAYAPAAAAVF
jgi:hypothetical protein